MKETYLSFTSIPARLPHIDDVVLGHVRLARRHNLSGVCLALQSDSVPAMTPLQLKLVDEGAVELLTIDKDHGSNTKWTLARRAHPDARLVVVDDDRVYPDSMAADLLEFAERRPSALACRALRTLAEPVGPGAPVGYSLARGAVDRARLVTCLNASAPTVVNPRRTVLEHWAGMLYPPGFPDPELAAEAAELAPHDDDVFLTTCASRAGIPVYLLPTADGMIYLRDMAKEAPAVRDSALGHDNRAKGWSRTRDAINRLRRYFF